jgi:hypothetical protein
MAWLSLLGRSVHSLGTSARLLALDGTHSLTTFGLKVTLFWTSLGPMSLPLGGVATNTTLTQCDYEEMFQSLLDVWNESAGDTQPFGGRGRPMVVMTDDEAAEWKAAEDLFKPDLTALCLVHVWRVR